MTNEVAGAGAPDQVARATYDGVDPSGDAADQAERLTMIMEAEATRNALHGVSGEGSLEGSPYPLEDVESMLAMEDAEDASDDPVHAGGLTPRTWVSAEVSAMHVVDLENPADDAYVDEETDAERANPFYDQFDGRPEDLTPEDETLLGIDPYEG